MRAGYGDPYRNTSASGGRMTYPTDPTNATESATVSATVAYAAGAVVAHRKQFGEELPPEETLEVPDLGALGPEGREALNIINPQQENHLDLTVLRREGAGGVTRSRRRRRTPANLPASAVTHEDVEAPPDAASEKIEGSFLPSAGRVPGRKFELSRRPTSAEDWNEVLVVYAGALVEQRERDARRSRTEAARLLGSVEETLRYGTYGKEDHPDLLRVRELASLLDEDGLSWLRRVERAWDRRPLQDPPGTALTPEDAESANRNEWPGHEEDWRSGTGGVSGGVAEGVADEWEEQSYDEQSYDLSEDYSTPDSSASEDYEHEEGHEEYAEPDERSRKPWVLPAILALLIVAGGFLSYRAFGGDEVSESESSGAQNAGAQNAGAQNAGAQNAGAQNAGREEAQAAAEPRQSNSEASGSAGPPDPGDEIVETGWVFEALPQKANGTVELTVENVKTDEKKTWEGVIENGGDGSNSDGSDEGEFDDLSLEGETFGNFRGGFDMPKGQLTNGSFATAIEGERVLHATYQQAREPGQDALQVADGTYKVMEEESGEILVSGTYSDEREPGSKKVVRLYRERSPESQEWRTFERAFEAPAETPIPLLVGNEEPAASGV